MKFHSLSFTIGIVLGVIVVGLILGIKITSQNKVIQEKEIEIIEKEKEIFKLQNTIITKQEEFQELKNSISKEKEQIEKQMQYITQPDLPIRVTIRNTFFSSTKVLQLTNYSNNAIRVNVSSNFEGRTQLRTVDLTPNRRYEIGQKEGFPFKSGDSVTIEAKGYRSLTKSFR